MKKIVGAFAVVAFMGATASVQATESEVDYFNPGENPYSDYQIGCRSAERNSDLTNETTEHAIKSILATGKFTEEEVRGDEAEIREQAVYELCKETYKQLHMK